VPLLVGQIGLRGTQVAGRTVTGVPASNTPRRVKINHPGHFVAGDQRLPDDEDAGSN
jgi:hypothetical protein